jgi:broad specificity phosphatase PhoE
MKVYLVRHGQVKNPHGINYGILPGWHLSEDGIYQISELGSRMKEKGLSFCTIITSPLERAQESASILSQVLNVQTKTDDRLLEWNMGEWMGKPLKEFYETSGYYSKEIFTGGMEPLEDLADRVITCIKDAVNSCEDDIIICSHREPMAAALTKLQNLPWPEIHNIDMPMASVWQLTLIKAVFNQQKNFLAISYRLSAIGYVIM